jgi:hypothetical protein
MDIGRKAVSGIRELLNVDREWSADEGRGFRWWGHDVGQFIQAVPVAGDDHSTARILVTTPMLASAGADARSADRVIAEMNQRSTGGAFRRLGTGEVVHDLALTVDDDLLDWAVQVASTAAILALTEGRRVAREFAPRLGSALAVSQHPVSGRRPDQDDMLNLTEQLIQPTGLQRSAWEHGEAFGGAALALNQAGVALAADTTGDMGLICEFGFGERATTFLYLGPTEDRPPSLAPGLPLLRPDAALGHGMLGWEILPMSVPVDEAARLAGLLNVAEAESLQREQLHVGAWTVWDAAGRPAPAYRVFVPNLLAGSTPPSAVGVNAFHRAALASSVLCPDERMMTGDALYGFMTERLEGLAADAAVTLPN